MFINKRSLKLKRQLNNIINKVHNHKYNNKKKKRKDLYNKMNSNNLVVKIVEVVLYKL